MSKIKSYWQERQNGCLFGRIRIGNRKDNGYLTRRHLAVIQRRWQAERIVYLSVESARIIDNLPTEITTE